MTVKTRRDSAQTTGYGQGTVDPADRAKRRAANKRARAQRRINRKRSQRGSAEGWAFGLLAATVLVLIAGAISFGVWNATYVQTKTCTVESKDRTSKPKGGSDMRLYTINCGVVQVTDSFLSWHFNSADVYQSIKAGHTYRLTMRGHRIPFLSQFPGVVKAEDVAR